MEKHYLRLSNCHLDNKIILLQCIKNNFFVSPQRMLPKSRGFRYIKIGPDRGKKQKQNCCQRNVISYEVGTSGVNPVMDSVPIPFQKSITFPYQIKMCEPQLLFRTNKHDFITEIIFWAILGKNQEHMFNLRGRPTHRKKHQPQRTFYQN